MFLSVIVIPLLFLHREQAQEANGSNNNMIPAQPQTKIKNKQCLV
jgi:hypothetical protein